MYFHFRHGLPSWWRRACTMLLALFWCVGLLLGLLAASLASDSVFPLMRTAAQTRVSIVGLLAVNFLPFLFSAFAVFLSEPRLLLPVCFLKAFCFGFCAFGISLAFGSAGWLVRWLLLFSDGCMIPLLCWFWLRHISGSKAGIWKDLVVCAAASVLIGSLDYCWISPFLAMLIEN